MWADALSRLERWAVAALAALVVLGAGALWLAPSWTQAASVDQFQMLRLWTRFTAGHAAIGAILPGLVVLNALLAGVLALALSLFPSSTRDIRVLRRALALGAGAVLYLFHVRLQLDATGVPLVLMDVSAFAAAGLAVADLWTFVAIYPRRASPEHLHANLRRQLVDPVRDVETWGPARRLFNGWFQSLSRAFNRRTRVSLTQSQPSAFDIEASLASGVSLAQAVLDLPTRRSVRMLLVALAATAGVVFSLYGSESRGPLGTALMIIVVVAPLLPMLAFDNLYVNYRYGSSEDRRRIGWMVLGPMFGFIAAAAIWWSLGLVAIASIAGGRDFVLLGMPLPSLALEVGTLLVFPVVVASFLLGLALSIFYHGSLDPRLALRRGALVALCGVLLTGLFVAVEGAVTSQVVTRFGMPDQVGAVIAGTMAAVAFAPLRNRMERRVDRLVERLMPARDLADGQRIELCVCFIDLSGYTALSERDEPAALLHAGLLQKCARESALAHGGDSIKSIGDGTLLRFPDPGAALAALRELVARYRDGMARLDVEPLPLHAGVHVGEVVVARDGDLYGATVNLAARLCTAAGGNHALLSDAALSRLEPGAASAGLQSFALKNVSAPVHAASVPLHAEPAAA